MQLFNKSYVAGTKVRLHGYTDFFSVESVHTTRKWIRINELVGCFQCKDIAQYTNK